MRFHGPLLIAFAAFLWATDALFRYPSIRALGAPALVLIEHAAGLIVLLSIVFFTKPALRLKGSKEWASAILIGAGGSAIATLFFTQSFLYLNPSTAILLQKIQPIVVILLAKIFLGETPAPTFYPWATVALVAALGVSAPSGISLSSLRGAGLAAMAAVLWGIATVAGKSLLAELKPLAVTFWRYFFGTVAATGILIFIRPTISVAELTSPHLVFSLLYIALGPGLLALLFYYRGQNKTRASVATLVELIFPLAAVLLNGLFLGVTLAPTQLVWGAVLLVAITRIQVPRRW